MKGTAVKIIFPVFGAPLKLNGSDWSASRPSHFNLAESVSNNHWPEGIMGPRNSLGSAKEKESLPLSEIEPRFFARPSRSPVSVLTNRKLLRYWNQGRWGRQDIKGR
jgi:hypothetical protein